MEYIDIVDENDRPLNYSMEKKEAHSKGCFHRAAHIWIINRNRELIIQRRSMLKDTCPGMWDISSAGHIQTGEKVLEGAIRELSEELGIHKNEDDFVFVGKIKHQSEHNREWCYIYLIYDDRDLDEYVFEDREVDEIKRVYYRELQNVENIVRHLREFALIQNFIEECRLIKDSEHLYHLQYCPDTDRPNLYLIKGRDYNVAVDAGNSRNHCLKFYLTLKLEDFAIPRYTVISHWHWDHSFGISAVKGIVLSSELTHSYLEKVKGYRWDMESMKERLEKGEEIQFCHDNILAEYPDCSEIVIKNSDEIIKERTVLDLGDVKIELIPRESTHSLDSLFVYIKDDEALIVEDADCPDYYHGEVYVRERLENMIEFFKRTDYRYHYLGHADRESKEEAVERLKEELKKL